MWIWSFLSMDQFSKWPTWSNFEHFVAFTFSVSRTNDLTVWMCSCEAHIVFILMLMCVGVLSSPVQSCLCSLWSGPSCPELPVHLWWCFPPRWWLSLPPSCSRSPLWRSSCWLQCEAAWQKASNMFTQSPNSLFKLLNTWNNSLINHLSSWTEALACFKQNYHTSSLHLPASQNKPYEDSSLTVVQPFFYVL